MCYQRAIAASGADMPPQESIVKLGVCGMLYATSAASSKLEAEKRLSARPGLRRTSSPMARLESSMTSPIVRGAQWRDRRMIGW